MHRRLLPILACPMCRGDLRLTAGEAEAERVDTGTLTCAGCARAFPIVRGIPRLLPGGLAEAE